MAQFYLTIFAESFKLSKTIFDLRKVVKVELFKRLELYHINSVKEVLDITLIAQNVFKVKVFWNIVLQQARAYVDVFESLSLAFFLWQIIHIYMIHWIGKIVISRGKQLKVVELCLGFDRLVEENELHWILHVRFKNRIVMRVLHLLKLALDNLE